MHHGRPRQSRRTDRLGPPAEREGKRKETERRMGREMIGDRGFAHSFKKAKSYLILSVCSTYISVFFIEEAFLAIVPPQAKLSFPSSLFGI